MTRAQVQPTPTATGSGSSHGRRSIVAAPVVAALALTLAACGGDDDASTTTPPSTTNAPVFTNPPTVPTPIETVPIETVPTSVVYVTEGASVMVTNASRVDGGAGRLSERLRAVGFTTVEPGNYTLGKLDTTLIYYDPANISARAVADSLKAAFGGGSIEVVELPAPPPVNTGDALGAGVLIAMGNDIADKSLDELQGITTTTTAAPGTSAPPTTGA